MASKVLIVEDEVIVGLDLAMQLEDEGFECLGPARTAEEALTLIEKTAPDFTVLDVNLGGTTSAAVAERLEALRRPFVYVSGYAEEGVLEKMPRAPLIQKPLRFDRLRSLISEMLAQGAGSPPERIR